MNVKRFIGALLVTFAFIFAFNWVFHGILLMDTYKATPELWRPMPEAGAKAEPTIYCYVMMVSQALMAFMLTFIFTRNYEGNGVGEGVRYGLYIGLLLATVNLGQFAYMPIEFTLAASWMLGSILTGLGSGVLMSLIYRR
jgi:hypothetical protein